jgi:hypothetical protein
MSEMLSFDKYFVQNQIKREINTDLLMHCPNYFGEFVREVTYFDLTGQLVLEVSNRLLMNPNLMKDAYVKLQRVIYEIDNNTIVQTTNQLYVIAYNCVLSEMRKNAIPVVVTVVDHSSTEIRFEHVKTDYIYVIKKNLVKRNMMDLLTIGSTWKLLLAANTYIDKSKVSSDIGAPLLYMAINLDVSRKGD